MNRKNIARFLFWIRLKKIFDLLPKKLRRSVISLGFTTFLTSIFDLIGIALFIPLLLLLLEDNYIQKYDKIRNLYNFLGFTSETNFTILILFLVFFLVISKNIASIFLTRKQSFIAMNLQTGISSTLLKSYLNHDFLKLKQHNSNQVVWRINSLPSFFVKSVILPLSTFVNELIVATIIGLGLFLYNPNIILLLSITIAPITFLFYRHIKRKIQVTQKKQSLLIPKLNALAQQSIFGYIDVILTNTKDFFSSHFDNVLEENKNLSAKIITFMSIPAKVIEISIISSITLLIFIGIIYDIDKNNTVKFLGIFALSAYRLIPSFNKMTVSILSFKSYQYTLNFLTHSLSNIQKEKKTTPSEEMSFKSSIEIKNLFFEYTKGSPVLNNISFTIQKGDTIGIIGKSGSGKTTLMNILLGLIQQTSGKILIDNKKTLQKSDLQQKVGYVQQSIFLTDGSIKENIAFGIPENLIDIDKIYRCIKDANLEELINSLPNGIETKVGELGSQISGGQKQRIGIARVLYSDAEILFFDEATSALDQDTEKQITNTLQLLSKSDKKLTMIIIAHRLSTLKHCNKIFKIDKGDLSLSQHLSTVQ
ncbi:MAG: ABC transporter ATP-binding protein/permease [Flavobacteriales bacterium]|jgi:ABC-type multidrug transport system fused ATPase/permease subunit|nr:ABC transporter ATP-binding protein/permease [Flavobacteriales bacterium]